MCGVAEPYQVKDFDVLAQKLFLGEWIVLRHEHLCDIDLDVWKEGIDLACVDVGIEVEFVDLRRKDITVVFNAARDKLPTEDQIHESIRRVARDRRLGHVPPTDLVAKTGVVLLH
ncbi:hypothetical protein ACFWY9_01455 [Amycolatopsis sp. NPDC059027]|uniref:hypothetical protein n=1 Tax=Amycolatopsis sp. NPDC059027 TaxID=3346709 RepID=UPI003672ADC6